MFRLEKYKDLKVRWAKYNSPMLGYAQGKIFSVTHGEVRSEFTDRAGIHYRLNIYSSRTMAVQMFYCWNISEKDITDELCERFLTAEAISTYTLDMLREMAATELVQRLHYEDMKHLRDDWYNFVLAKEVLKTL
jgi:hypothetical protein